MRAFIILLAVVFCTIINAQEIVYEKQYFGENSEINEITIPAMPNQYYNIDLATEFIPDWLIIYTNELKTDSIQFYIGDYLSPFQISNNANYYSGYCEFLYDDSLSIIANNINGLPNNFTYKGGQHNGKLRVTFKVPEHMCNLSIKMIGNCCSPTIYSLSIIKTINDIVPIQDTIILDICEFKENEIIYNNCTKHYIIYNDKSIKTEVIVKNPTCIDSLNGSISFINYSRFDQNNLQYGEYKILVSNNFCEKEFTFDLKYQLLCKYFIPNVFNPNLDGENDFFGLFTPDDINYKMMIFDRWGNFIYENTLISNNFGWDGTFRNEKCDEGVYVYKIIALDEVLNGTITLLR